MMKFLPAALLLSLSLAAAESQTAPARELSTATCAGYVCPVSQGWKLRTNAQDIQCFMDPCSSVDKTTCCVKTGAAAGQQGQATQAPTTAAPTTAAPTTAAPTTAAPTQAPATAAPSTTVAPATAAPTTAAAPCAPVIAGQPAPQNPCTTVAPAATCAGYKCPAGMTLRPLPQNIKCLLASGCTGTDKGTCCLAPTPVTPAPTPAPTVAPAPASCKVDIPDGGFQPWEVYKVLKSQLGGRNAHVTTPAKAIAGGQTMNFTNMRVRASAFSCQKVNDEWRAQSRASSSNFAQLSVHDALQPWTSHIQCLLTGVSIYMSDGGIPGLRLDYGNCPRGPGKQASVLVGLKKVPDTYGAVPGLANFFKDVCDDADKETEVDYKLSFDLIDSLRGEGCWAHSADMTLMRSPQNCFESAFVFTFMNANNHFPLFPVTDSEWTYLTSKLAKNQPAAVPAAPASPCAKTVPTPPPKNPCAPVVHKPPPYANIIQDRLCIAMPDLSCHNNCGKVCVPVAPKTLPTTTPFVPCKSCYDCEIDEIAYAIAGTILTFWLCLTTYRISVDYNLFWFSSEKQVPDANYSPILLNGQVNNDTWRSTSIFFFFMAWFWSTVAYVTINMLDWLSVNIGWKNGMCVKILKEQSDLVSHEHMWSFGAGSRTYTCLNDVCPWRLSGLIITTWLSIWGLFVWWRYNLNIRYVQTQVRSTEFVIESEGGGFGGTAANVCTVQ